jgi:hypothetical protein
MARLDDTMGQADRAGRMACPAPWHNRREREREMQMSTERSSDRRALGWCATAASGSGDK